jgi:hypothetical protein
LKLQFLKPTSISKFQKILGLSSFERRRLISFGQLKRGKKLLDITTTSHPLFFSHPWHPVTLKTWRSLHYQTFSKTHNFLIQNFHAITTTANNNKIITAVVATFEQICNFS